MCMWDVVHGRRRYYKKTNGTLAVAAQLNIAGNARRVAIRFAANTAGGAQAYIYDLALWAAGNLGQELATLIGPYAPMVEFTVERHGSLVMGAFTLLSLTNGGQFSVTEIITNEEFEED